MIQTEKSRETTVARSGACLFALVLALTAGAGATLGADYDSDAPYAKKPRWSNDFHHLEGTMVTRDCGLVPSPENQAQYVPGVDAWGRPVVPAGTIQPYGGPPIYGELDVHLRKMQVGSHQAHLTGKIPIPLDPNAWQQNGSTRRDCFPVSK